MMVRVENQTIIGKKMNRGIYAITAIGENKKNRTISVQYISMPYSPVSAGGCGFIDGKLGCLCLETKEEFYV